MHLEKYHGLGNDFLVLLDLDGRQPLDAALARALCDRHRGVGADGLIRVTAGTEGCDVTMELRNADGSRAETSGNGLRCLVRAVMDAGVAAGPGMTVHTDAGVRAATIHDDGLVSVAMGAAMMGDDQQPGPDGFEAARAVSLGNPHLVLLGPDPATLDVADLGPKLEAEHPDGVNVEFVAVASRGAGGAGGALAMRVWERGVGETESCGSGACAAAAAAEAWGLVGRRVTVRQPGGELVVKLGTEMVLTGPAEHVCTVDVACP